MRQVKNLLATLFLSQGVPMLLGGDELGRTQRGNNNAYCQDNEISWYDWDLDAHDREVLDFVRKLTAIRREHPVLRRSRFFQGVHVRGSELKDLAWFRPDGEEMTRQDWDTPGRALAFLLGGDAIPQIGDHGQPVEGDTLLVLFNGERTPKTFRLPDIEWGEAWECLLDTSASTSDPAPKRVPAKRTAKKTGGLTPLGVGEPHARDEVELEALSVVVLRRKREPGET
jgi:glycogen operon protein